MFIQNLHTDVFGSFIHNFQNLAATKKSFNRGIDKQTMEHPDNGILFSDEKK